MLMIQRWAAALRWNYFYSHGCQLQASKNLSLSSLTFIMMSFLSIKTDSKVKLVDIALGLHNVWAVDSVGCIHFRSGIRQPSDRRVSPAWIQMPPDAPASRDSGSKQTHVETYHLARIFAGPNDWMVGNRLGVR
jgi:hypothetical protein